MKLKFSWLNSRKSLILALIIDYLIFYYLFFLVFNSSILNKSLLIFFSILNPLIWIIISYVVGRYENIKKEKLFLVINKFFKTFLIIFLSLFFILFQFKIFWNWEYLYFESFSEFVNDISDFYLRLFLLSGLSQFILSLYISEKYSRKTLWLFLGDKNRSNYLKKIIGKKSNFKIKLYNPKYLNINKFNGNGIIIDDEESVRKKNIQFIFDLNNKGLKFMKISNWCQRYLNRYPSDLIKIAEIIDGQFNHNEYSFKGRIKRIADTFVSLLILIFSLPILLIASVLIKIEDGGPIFYTQVRNGFEGKKFKIIKLRTMIINAEKNGEQWSNKFDQRITNIGQILRKLRIDELPQLLLVISGEMSLIGPRPERPNIDNYLKEKIPNYDLRYSIKPGISGWAQVNFPYGASLEDSKYKLSYDLYYIKNFSILLDCMILFKTIKLVFQGKGSKPNENK